MLSLLPVLSPSYLQFPWIWFAAHDVNGFLSFSSPSDETESERPLSVVYNLSAYTSLDEGESHILGLA